MATTEPRAAQKSTGGVPRRDDMLRSYSVRGSAREPNVGRKGSPPSRHVILSLRSSSLANANTRRKRSLPSEMGSDAHRLGLGGAEHRSLTSHSSWSLT